MSKHIHITGMFLVMIFCLPSLAQITADVTTATVTYRTEIVPSVVPDNIARTIKQDRSGNIWIAAFDGVFRYDGKSFVNITSRVTNARFFSVLQDRMGNFWLCTVGEGIYYYDGITFKHFTTADGLGDDRVTDIYEDRSGNIWFGTEGGATRYDGKAFRNYLMKFDPAGAIDTVGIGDILHKGRSSFHKPATGKKQLDNQINSIVEDKKGNFWFATRGSAYMYDGVTFSSFPHGNTFFNVRTVIEDRKGNIWLGGTDGLWRFDGDKFAKLTGDFVGYVYEDRQGNIWTTSESSDGWVLTRYDANTLSNDRPKAKVIKSRYEGNRGMIFGILQAQDGSIWFGSLNGVHRSQGDTITDFKTKEVPKE